MRRDERATHRVTVFGAGIAGLTAAHELAGRGFKVQVIDPDINDAIHEDTLDRGIGGMARSQWAFVPNEALSPGNMQRLWAGDELLLDRTIRFVRNADGSAAPADPAYASTLLDALIAAFGKLDEAKLPRSTITLRIPEPQNDKSKAPTFDAMHAFLVAELKKRGLAKPESFLYPWASKDPSCVTFAQMGHVVPAEHGFRFFPSFYRHLFDTMRRTRILRPRESERTKRTAFDNLVPTVGLGFARSGKARSFMIARRMPQSFEEIRTTLMEVLGELGYTLEDIGRFQLKLFKYMTTSPARRARELEHTSWGAFLDSSKFSPISREHIEFGPQMSAALRGSLSDARTQGNITVQLLLDQLKPNAECDYTLGGPTSGAWLDHWHDFLIDQDVEFARGKLEDFEVVGDAVVPKVAGATPSGDYFVLALSLPEIRKLAPKFLIAARKAGIPEEKLRDFRAIETFAGDLADLQTPTPKGPLQHLSGIQYFFDEDVRFWSGHTQYLDSAWGLTSIAQPQFWWRARDAADEYRSILSVDIGIFDRPFEGKTAWECTAHEIAQRAWTQIEEHHLNAFREKYGPHAVFPHPIAYALDAKLIFQPRNGHEKTNESPFLVNRTSKYDQRPGRVLRAKNESKTKSVYEVIGNYVIAGTFMQTFTRLTSMEGANESARHAVNALLQVWRTGGDRCDIWDPEDNEIGDLQWLKDLDEALLAKNLPHFIDILDWSELPDRIVPHQLIGAITRRSL